MSGQPTRCKPTAFQQVCELILKHLVAITSILSVLWYGGRPLQFWLAHIFTAAPALILQGLRFANHGYGMTGQYGNHSEK